MNGAIIFEGGTNLIDIESDKVANLDIGDLPLRLHMAEPAQGWSAVFVEEEFEEAFGAD